MSVADLKIRLADVPGIETLTLQLIGGRQVFGFAGMIAAVDPLANDQEIENTIRAAAARKAAYLAKSTPLPDAGLMPAPTREAKPMGVTGASHVGANLKTRMDDLKGKIAAGQSKIDAGLSKMEQAAEATNQFGEQLGSEADDLLATLGQFTNGAPTPNPMGPTVRLFPGTGCRDMRPPRLG
jgi:hypothetical protein